jgi:predicted dehydrogenase
VPPHSVYLVGAGEIAHHHANAVAKLGGTAVLAGVADPNDEALGAFAELHPEVSTFSNAEEMLAAPPGEYDIVIVATPPWTHGELSIRALETGRHVLCEKPFATDVATAEAMGAAARRADRLIGCCSSRFLGLPTSTAVLALLAAGELGRPYRVAFVHRHQRARSGVEYQPGSRWFLSRDLNGGGVLSDWGPYDLALLNEILRPKVVTVAHAWYANPRTGGIPADVRFDVEEHVAATLIYRLPDGSEVVVDYERAACTHGTERSVVEIEGVDGAVSWDWVMLGDDSVTITTDRDGKAVSTERRYAVDDDLNMHDRPLAYLVRRIRGEDAPIPVGDAAVFNLRCLRAIYEAAETQTPVTVQR